MKIKLFLEKIEEKDRGGFVGCGGWWGWKVEERDAIISCISFSLYLDMKRIGIGLQ